MSLFFAMELVASICLAQGATTLRFTLLVFTFALQKLRPRNLVGFNWKSSLGSNYVVASSEVIRALFNCLCEISLVDHILKEKNLIHRMLIRGTVELGKYRTK